MKELSTRKAIFGTGKKLTAATNSSEFRRSIAIIIGIDKYSNGIPPLATAVNDATRLAQILKEQHGYSVMLLTDEEAVLPRLQSLFCDEAVKNLSKDDRLLLYFAGHGVASDGDNGPEGFLIPQGAKLAEETFWPMTTLHSELEKLECRHMLAILDCCFAGAFRWSSKRAFQPLPSVIHKERYERFIRSSAWQVITSAAHNQKALDILVGNVLGAHGIAHQENQPHSPFALSLFEALNGAADSTPKGGDGVITATELYLYLRDQVEVSAEQQADHQQTPGIWPLNKHRHGEFIFLTPGREVNLPPAPDLIEENNPYKGLSSYEKTDRKLFFGRTALIEKLRQKVEEQPFTVVLGASGTGKSSLVKAGLLPALEEDTKKSAEQSDAALWFLLEKKVEKEGKETREVFRPGANPLAALRSLLASELPEQAVLTLAGFVTQWRGKNPGSKLLLVVDQAEELITLCRQEQERKDFVQELMQALHEYSEVLRVVLTLRSDFEAQILQTDLKKYWQDKNRFVVPPMTQDELREVIEQPASVMVLYFEPHELIDRLINEVIQTPGALPLLSFTLSELYLRYVKRQKDVEQQDGNRALTEADYQEIGGVIGSLRRRINQEYEQLDAAHQATMRRILLRMVAFEGGEMTRRRVPKWELEYPDAAENERVAKIVEMLSQARLVVAGESENSKGESESYIEPAHDALIVAWDKLLKWKAEEAETLLLHRQLTRAAADWQGSAENKEKKGLLWDNSPRLMRVQEILELKWSRGRGISVGHGMFRRTKQFCRVLFPSFKHLEQHIWLNRVETDFVRRSVERKRNWTRGVMAFVLAVIVSLSVITFFALVQKDKAVEKERQSRYQLGMTYWNNGFSYQENDLKSLHYFALAENVFASLEEEGVDKKNNQFVENSRFSRTSRQRYIKLIAVMTGYYVMSNGDKMLTRSTDGEISVLDNRNGMVKFSLIHSHKGAYDGSFNNDGSRILTWVKGGGVVYLWDGSNGRMLFHLNEKYPVEKAEFIPDGNKFCLYSTDSGTIYIFDSKDGKEIFSLKHININNVKFNTDGSRIITWDKKKKTVHFLNGNNGKILFSIESEFDNVEFNLDGRYLLTWLEDRDVVYLWDANNGKMLFQLKHKHAVEKALFNRDGKIFTITNDRGAKFFNIWDGISGKLLISSKDYRDFAFNADGTKILVWSSDSGVGVGVLDSKSGEELTPSLLHKNNVRGAKFSIDGSRILTWSSTLSGSNTSACIWDSKAGQLLAPCLEVEGDFSIDDAKFIRNGKGVIFGNRVWNIENINNTSFPERKYSNMTHIKGYKKNILIIDDKKNILDINSGVLLCSLSLFGNVINARFNDSGSKILTWTMDKGKKTLRILDSTTCKENFNVEIDHDEKQHGYGSYRKKLSILSKDGEKIILQDNKKLRVVDLINSKDFFSIPYDCAGDNDDYYGALFENSGGRVLIWDNKNSVISIFETKTGNISNGPFKYEAGIAGAILNSTGKKVLIWGGDAAQVLDMENGKPITPELKHDVEVFGAIFNNDESRILTWSGDSSGEVIDREGYAVAFARVWDSNTGVPLTPKLVHQDSINGALFDRYENKIMTYSFDGTVKMWDSNTGSVLMSLPPNDNYNFSPIDEAVFDEDQSRIITLDQHGGVHIFNIPVERWPSNKVSLKIEVETGTEMTNIGEIMVLSENEWHKKRWCEYDKIQYELKRITDEEWETSKRLCKQLNLSEK